MTKVLNEDKVDSMGKEQATTAQLAMKQVLGEGESYTHRNLSIQANTALKSEILHDSKQIIFSYPSELMSTAWSF